MTPNPPPHERLAAAIDDRRADLGLSLREVAEAAGITTQTLQAVRRGSNQPSPLTRRGIERALGWEAASIEAILAGGEPTVRDREVEQAEADVDNARAYAWRAERDAEEADDPKMQRAMELLAQATAMLEEIRRERRKGA